MKAGSFASGIAAAAVALCLAVAAWFAPSAAWATEAVDLSATGSIQVTQKASAGKAVPGGTITMYRVADVVESNGVFSYTLTSGFLDSGVKLGDLSDSGLAASLEKAIPEGLEGDTTKFDSKGTAAFGNLSVGVYLLVQEEATSGYSALKPFVVSVPTKASDGSLTYSVNASPKMSTVSADTPTVPSTPGSNGGSGSGSGTLPQTGQLLWPIAALAGAGVVLFCIGWVLRRGGKRSHEA